MQERPANVQPPIHRNICLLPFDENSFHRQGTLILTELNIFHFAFDFVIHIVGSDLSPGFTSVTRTIRVARKITFKKYSTMQQYIQFGGFDDSLWTRHCITQQHNLHRTILITTLAIYMRLCLCSFHCFPWLFFPLFFKYLHKYANKNLLEIEFKFSENILVVLGSALLFLIKWMITLCKCNNFP